MSRLRAALALLVVSVCVAAASDDLPRTAGYLGVRIIAAVPDEVRARARLSPGQGAMVETVFPDTAAARAGLRPGDLLLTIDGRAIDEAGGFLQSVSRMKFGSRFVLGVVRDGQRFTTPVTVGLRPPDRGETFDVLYRHVRSKAGRIRTIVTRPHTSGPHPALMLIQGLGPTSIDEPLAGPSAYSRILKAFADAGYVTVRVEKPGIGDSEGGPYVDTDFVTELDIYRQALLALTTTDFVDREKIFVFGHSIGGVFAPMLATEIPVRGLMVYGTVVKPWIDYAMENTRRQAALAGSTKEDIDATARALAVVMNDVFVEGKTTVEVARLRPSMRSVLERFFPEGRYTGRSVRFWSQLQRTDLAATWTKASGDVLVVWGRNDFIATEEDHPRIVTIVETARPGKAIYIEIDGADHGFRRTTSIEDSYRRWTTPRGEVNDTVITVLKMWTERMRHAQ